MQVHGGEARIRVRHLSVGMQAKRVCGVKRKHEYKKKRTGTFCFGTVGAPQYLRSRTCARARTAVRLDPSRYTWRMQSSLNVPRDRIDLCGQCLGTASRTRGTCGFHSLGNTHAPISTTNRLHPSRTIVKELWLPRRRLRRVLFDCLPFILPVSTVPTNCTSLTSAVRHLHNRQHAHLCLLSPAFAQWLALSGPLLDFCQSPRRCRPAALCPPQRPWHDF